ncbi:uncharacterized protein LOC108913354 [Anoplophora glabripennis]|uniref:uncharacterized protein LOC108913354 n=1 Tax=Anoplophora glabripennis TaxID=217634 RepID=UPI00087524DA|nr:uncharacterized protein LOC108913354 [Anoplophora glabripennis]
MAVQNICRLCLATDDLVYIFDEKNKKLNMKDVIAITTGIEIHTKDIISQKVCGKCYQFSIQIFQFRSQCLKADKHLKNLCMDFLVDKKYYIPNTEVSIKGVLKSEELPKIEPDFMKTSVYELHPSVIKLSRTYPKIKLPKDCLTSDVAPIVQMEINQVENYFKRLKLNFNIHVKNALDSVKRSIKPTKFSKIQKFPKQKKILTLPKVIKITKINEPIKTKQHYKSATNFNEIENNRSEVCKTPNKSPVKRNNKSTIHSNVKRKLIESPSTEAVEKPHLKTVHCTDTCITIPSKKRRLVTEKCQQETHYCKKTFLNETEVYCSLTTRRQKLIAAANCSNKKSVDVGIFSKSTLKKFQNDSKKVDEKYCALKEKMIVQPIKIANDKVDLQISSPNKNLANRNENQLNENDEHVSLTSVGRSVPLFVCQICNSVLYNKYELKKHQNKHMRCQFCKVRFRSLENKKRHIENVCLIRKMMSDLPYVSLVKIDYNRIIRQTYSEAFAGFSPLKNMYMTHREKNSNNSSIKETLFKDLPPERLSIIEILSDDEDLPFSVSDKEQLPIIANISSNVFTNLNLKTSKNELLKNLLTTFPRPSKEIETQTELLTNCHISVTETNEAVLKNLLPYMFMYNIPVKVEPGKFNVTYDYSLKSNPTKKLSLWNELIPINIKSRAEDGDSFSKVVNDASNKR